MYNESNNNILNITSEKSINEDRERSKREEVCEGKCRRDLPLILLDEWPNPSHKGAVEKLRTMRCSEHCGKRSEG